MEYVPRALLQKIVTTATDATGASTGWLASIVDGRELAIVAVASNDPGTADRLLWQRAPLGTGSAGFAVQSGQPVALQPGSSTGDEWSQTLLARSPASIVVVPCEDGERAVGALQLVDKAGGGPFSFDDVEMASVLAGIAGAALAEGAGSAGQVPQPAELGADLARLAAADPGRYAGIAQAIAALLGQA